jgi:hypothetical protein
VSGFSRTLQAQITDTYLMVITGVEADQSDTVQFRDWAMKIIDAAKSRGGIAEGNIIYLADKPGTDKPAAGGRSTRERIAQAFTDLAAKVKPNDEVAIVLIGHGTFDGRMAAFNIPGPDLTAGDYSKLLDRFLAQRVVFVNTAGSSGAFIDVLKGPGRVIVTATRTGGERNDTLFPQYFAEAFENGNGDKNGDGRVSISEAFEYAKNKVTQSYQQKGVLLTEHAALEDGSGGKLADAVFLDSPRARAAALASVTDPALRALLEQKQALEDQIAALKAKKETMDPAQYDQALETLLLDLAQKTRAIQQLQGVKK